MTNSGFPAFHDGYLTSVAVGEKRATLGFMTYDGSEYELVLEGVEALVMNDFREGNIVLDLEVITGSDRDIKDNDFGELFRPPHPSDETHYHKIYSSMLATRIKRIKSGEATLVTVSPSYGADFLAYCMTVTLSGPKWDAS